MPTEVRQVDPKGTLTTFSRPMPGSARMYPETDIKNIEITKLFLNKQTKLLPELYNEKIKRLTNTFKLDEQKLIKFLSVYNEKEIKELIKTKLKPAQIYSTIFDLPKEIKKREKIEPIKLEFSLTKKILIALNENKLNKKTIYTLHTQLYKNKTTNIDNLNQYLKNNNLITKDIDTKKVEIEIKEIIINNPKAPFGALMGICMKHFKGEVDGKIISETLKKSM